MNLEAKLEEYRQVCADRRQLFERRDRTLYLALFVFTGIIGIGIQWEIPILFILTSFILLFLWCNEILRQFAIYRYNAYIEVIIKKDIKELERTSIGQFHPYHKDWRRVIPYLSIPFLVLICYFFGYFFKNSCNRVIPSHLLLIFGTISFICFISLVIWSFRVLYPKCKYRENEKKKWEDAQKEWEEKQKELKDKNKSIPQ